MAKDEKKEKIEEKISVVIYKANLHCPKCAHDIRKPLLRHPGVHSVDVKFEKSEITVKGDIDSKKIQEKIVKWSRKKVDILSEAKEPRKKDPKKDEIIKTVKIKAYMHCDKCENDLRRKLLMHKGIHNAKTDIKSQTVTIEGTLEAEKIVEYMGMRVHKHAEIIPPPKVIEKRVEAKEKVTAEVKPPENKKIIEFKDEKKLEVKTGDVPYFIHYVYAPQIFSDENPNACTIM